MKSNSKDLVKVENNSIICKIKCFFSNLFFKNKLEDNNAKIEETPDVSNKNLEEKNNFIESIKCVETEETKMLKLQKQYDNGEIKAEEISNERIGALISLYKNQVSELAKTNEIRKNKIRAQIKNKDK